MNTNRSRFALNRFVGTALAVLCATSVLAQEQTAKGKAEHVVVMVWDGMRPDFIRPQWTPTLYELSRKGVFFKNHHPVYVSSTEVNGTALVTGMYPEHSGIAANTDYRPGIRFLEAGGTETIESVRRGDLATGGNYIAVPTLPEIIQAAGHRTIVAGTKSVALLLDRSNKRSSGAAANSVNLFRGQTLPRAAMQALIKVNDDKGFNTNITHPNTGQDAWTTKALTDELWKSGVPKLSIFWHSDPDYSQHEAGPGSATAIGALESADKNLAAVLKALDEKGVRSKTDVIVVSDHGFSTIGRAVDLPHMFRHAGLKAMKKFDDPEPGEILVVGLGGSAAIYVVSHDEIVIGKTVEFLQASDFAGVIMCRTPIEGTFPMSTLRTDTTNAPDILVSFRWSGDRSDSGTPGMVVSEGGTKGKGTHGSLSRFDMHNTLVASGPDFKSGFIDELPSGNADVTPTILAILGLHPPQPLDGRILSEALVFAPTPGLKPETKTIEAIKEADLFRWRQYLKFTTLGSQIYFDEGNGESVWK